MELTKPYLINKRMYNLKVSFLKEEIIITKIKKDNEVETKSFNSLFDFVHHLLIENISNKDFISLMKTYTLTYKI